MIGFSVHTCFLCSSDRPNSSLGQINVSQLGLDQEACSVPYRRIPLHSCSGCDSLFSNCSEKYKVLVSLCFYCSTRKQLPLHCKIQLNICLIICAFRDVFPRVTFPALLHLSSDPLPPTPPHLFLRHLFHLTDNFPHLKGPDLIVSIRRIKHGERVLLYVENDWVYLRISIFATLDLKVSTH